MMQRISLSGIVRNPERLGQIRQQATEYHTRIAKRQTQQSRQQQHIEAISRNCFTTKAGTKYAKIKKGSGRSSDGNSSSTETVESLSQTTTTTSSAIVEPFHASTSTAAGTLTDVRKAFDWVVVGPYGIQRIDYTTSPIPPKWPLPIPPPPRTNFVRRYLGLVIGIVSICGGVFIVLNADNTVYDYWKRVEQGDVPVGDEEDDNDDDDDDDDDLENFDEDQDEWADQTTTNSKK